ncbi:MAG TPA: FAD-dependent monooxygenase [Ramlibacter sp.]|jgi:2-polyprenyl-6-methoxyphenol hydroxylase-like FAD-dependent oxidoreductase|uniref:FAD-dependent monooxygenase n=1 Tax=Ramlibacter sp. TaxID=1917967 RepID=UPI002D6BE778|nr:FAD-dependent monooxygenase [Ramlibacter sp.]HZY19820.1 FAD-dependent monooxygenase [Ramlibacter sp.]
MPLSLDVCVRGAGIVGRSLALLLAAERLRVGLVQGGPPPATADVRAYALNAASRQLLESVRAWPDDAHATPVLGMEVHGDDGGVVRFQAGTDPALAWIVDVPALEQRLADALRFQPGVTLLEQPQPAALTVVCEGRGSSTREEFGVQYDVHPYGQCAIAARLRCDRPHGHVARQWFAGGEVLALLPLGGSAAPDGGSTVALVWSVRQDRTAALMQAEPAAFETLVTNASHESLGRLTLAGERATWPLQIAQADRWCGAGWALAGDAAHSVHPLAGQGLNLGLADARSLAQVLREREYWRGLGDAKLLRRYERARKADVLAIGGATDGLQQLFAQEHPAWAAVRNWGMRGFEAAGPLKAWVVRQAAGRL